jgi:YD repeat-containing protein
MPSKIIRNNLEFKFGYDEQKRIISKETAERKIDYIYSDGGRLVSARITPKKVKSATAEMHQFNYDKENRLASVNLKNDTIRYSYDKKGRLTKIQTKAGPNFSILNDGLTGQVKRITAVGIGHFDIQYKNGKILKSKWKGELSKALAVIDTYELLRGPYEQSMEFGVPK